MNHQSLSKFTGIVCKLTLSVIALLIVFGSYLTAKANFSETLIITDQNFTNKNSMTADEINNFLASKGSWLANYVIPEYILVPYPVTDGTSVWLENANVRQAYVLDGQTIATFYNKTVAQLIYDEAQEHNINPKVVLSILQRESSAITRSQPSSKTTETWPMFYLYDERMASCLVGVISQCDNAGYYQRAIDFGGVGQQIAYATAWFDKRYKSFVDTYNQPILIDNNTLICESIATRVLYLYTPHIYPAQKNFYDYYALWWSKPNVNSINDTEALISKTYNPSVTLTGSKDVDTRVYIRSTNTLVADLGTPSWVLTVEAPGGTTVYTLEYQKEDGTILATKTLEIKRHKMADINGDNQVDLLDLSMLADHWNHVHPGEPMVDLNADGTVDLLDLSILASNWSS